MFFQDLLQFPFLQRAVMASVLIAPMLASLGVFVTLRGMALFGEGIAHASLAGIAIAVLAGMAPLPIAIAWAIFVALALFWFERKTRLSSDTLIGIAFTASMALGVVLMSLTKRLSDRASYISIRKYPSNQYNRCVRDCRAIPCDGILALARIPSVDFALAFRRNRGGFRHSHAMAHARIVCHARDHNRAWCENSWNHSDFRASHHPAGHKSPAHRLVQIVFLRRRRSL